MYTVTLNYNCNYGYVQFDELTKKVKVTLGVESARAAAEKFFTEPMQLDVPQGSTIRDFVTNTFDPLASLENFKVCLTRLWGKTGVRVEWSMPPGMAENL